MIRRLTVLFAFSGASLLFSASAAAQTAAPVEADKKSCEGKMSGDACTRSGRADGTCRPESKDSATLVCDDAVAQQKGDVACLGKAKGDPCPRPTGAAGVCAADESNAAQLRCKDTSPVNPSSSCSMPAGGAGGGTAAALAALGLVAVCVRRRRR